MNENELTLAVRRDAGTEIMVHNPATYAQAGEFLTALKTRIKQVRDFFAEPKKKAAEAHKSICAKEHELLDPLDAAERSLKLKMADYLAIEEKRRQAEEERRVTEARKLMEVAAEAESIGESELAAEAVVAAAMESASVTATPRAAGVSIRKIWRFRVVDTAQVPREWMVVNEAALAALAKGFGEVPALKIPGVEFYQDTVIAARAK